MHPFASVNRGGEASPSVPGTRNLLTCQSLSPTMDEHSIKSGGGTGPTMPRQPVSRNAGRPGANSRSEEKYSDEDGESVNLVTLATLGGMNDTTTYLVLWINARSFRTFDVGSVAVATPRRLSTSANSISAPSKQPTIMKQSAGP